MGAREENEEVVELAKILAKDKEFLQCGNNFHRTLYIKQKYPRIAQLPLNLINQVISIAQNISYEESRK